MKTIKNSLVQFCQQTSLHGWPYLVNEEYISAKVLWMIAQIGFVTFATILMTSNVIVYWDSTTKTFLESTTSPLDELSFPATFICNNNQIKASFLNQLLNHNVWAPNVSWNSTFKEKIRHSFHEQFLHGKEENDKALASLVKEILRKEFNWTDMIPIQEIAAPRCGKDMFLTVKSKGKEEKGYQYAYNEPTSYGICCMISQHWITSGFNKTDGFNSDDFDSPLGMSPSVAAGVTILADLESFDYAYRKGVSTGFYVVLGDSSDKPIPNINGLIVAPGFETLISFGVTKTYITKAAKEHLSPDQRGCYDPSEINLTYHKPENGYKYGMTHCLYDSKLQNIMKQCNCSPDFISSKEIKKWKTKKVCIEKQLECSEEWTTLPSEEKLKALGEVEVFENADTITKKCLPSCDTDEIKISTSFSTFPNYAVFLDRKEVCLVLQKLVRICTDETYQAKKESFEKVYGSHGTNGSICDDLVIPYNEDDMCKGKYLKNHHKTKHAYVIDFLYKYSQENLSLIKIAMRDQFYTKVKKDLEISRLDFFNSVGGMMGLCLGLSIISVFEVFFHILKFLLCRNK